MTTLQVAQIVAATAAEGPGRRFALWLQGCPLRCPGCCNPEMLSFEGGQSLELDELLGQIRQAHAQQQIEGLTLLGGEPFAHAAAVGELAERVQAAGLSMMVFSGYTLAELQQMSEASVARLLSQIDILVDGPYLREQPETGRRWIGSANQQIHFLSSRYRADDPAWQMPNTLEIRLTAGALEVNGFPTAKARDFWRQLPRHAQQG
jgi:anaerobic ribonucleoside-triphosphate reductase activating protein